MSLIDQYTGPIYNVPLIESLPFSTSRPDGMRQAMPNRDDLKRAHKVSGRAAAGYEVLLAHYHGQVQEIRRLTNALQASLRWLGCSPQPPPAGHVCGPESGCDYGCQVWADYQQDLELVRAATAKAREAGQ